MSKSIPDRWLDYKSYGTFINNTNILPFKVPLKEVNWEIVAERCALLDRLFALLTDWVDWKGPLPNLRDSFSPKEIESLLTDCTEIYLSREEDRYEAKLIIEFVIESGYKDEPEVDEDGKPVLHRTTAVHCALTRGRSSTTEQLAHDLFKIYDRLDVNYVDSKSGLTHFHVACLHGLYDVVERFLERGQDPNCSTRECEPIAPYPPLQMAMESKNNKLVELLLRRGADPSLTSGEEKWTALHYICQMEVFDSDLAKLFFEVCDDLKLTVEIDARDIEGSTPVYWAMRLSNKPLVELLLRRGADPHIANDKGYTLLHALVDYTDDDDLSEMFFDICDDLKLTLEIDARDYQGFTPVYWAMSLSNKPLVELLLRRGADPHIANFDGFTLLHVLSHYTDDDDFSEMFFDICDDLKLTLEIDAANKLGGTPLHEAVRLGKKRVMEQLLRRGADANLPNNDGSTPVHFLCRRNDRGDELAKIFFDICDDLKLTVEIDATSKSGNTPLHLAIGLGKKRVMEQLLRRGADPNLANNDEGTPLHIICEHSDDDDDWMQIFLEICEEQQQTVLIDAANQWGNTPLQDALRCRHRRLVALLLRRGANANLVNEERSTPLHFICQYHDDDDLLEMFFDICEEQRQTVLYNAQDKSGKTPLYRAVECGNKKVMEKLLRKGVDLNLANNNGWTPLHYICYYCGFNFLEIFFKICDDQQRTVNVNAQDKKGKTPLREALDANEIEVAKVLLRRGANLYLADKDGSTPLHVICKRTDDDDDLLKMFFDICEGQQQTALIDAANKLGNAPLHLALASDNIEMAKVLLRRGADPNIANSVGWTPLHLICQFDEDYYLAEMFFDICDDLKLTLEIDAANKLGNTPLHLALLYNDQWRTIELLLRRGADPNSVNEEGQTPLHMICQSASSRDELLAMFPWLAQLRVMDRLGRTPLQWAVENLLPRVVDILLEHGADLSSFVFPTASDFDERLDTRAFSGIYTNFKLMMASSLLVIAENLEQRGYEFSRSDALTIMKFFAERDLFEKPSAALERSWCDDEEFTTNAKEMMIKDNDSSLSLYEWSKLTPEEEGNLLTYTDYFGYARSNEFSILPVGVEEPYALHMCEMMSRGFFRVWALDPFVKLTNYRLPIICCEQILSKMRNEDLYPLRGSLQSEFARYTTNDAIHIKCLTCQSNIGKNREDRRALSRSSRGGTTTTMMQRTECTADNKSQLGLSYSVSLPISAPLHLVTRPIYATTITAFATPCAYHYVLLLLLLLRLFASRIYIKISARRVSSLSAAGMGLETTP
ncbi:unnamed protein product [Trichogramma brassicae]|uniref:Uncharacterized protein n=1 Tax=Trichogramma brassicae TaxID=86971 RepID=A0A6H5J7N6_9HYME|nr:unnamed protein product [Trichogramma brassicae]